MVRTNIPDFSQYLEPATENSEVTKAEMLRYDYLLRQVVLKIIVYLR